jgi:16S rRNA (cytosine967-C5)-methyltransferase
MPSEDSRTTALRILTEYERTGTYLNVLLSSSLAGSSLERRDRALVTELVQGTVRMKLALDSALLRFSNRPVAELDAGVLWALRLGAYQVLFTSAPDYAALDATAAATAAVVEQYAVGYVNGVLRAFTRGDRAIGYPAKEVDPAGYLEVRYSHPRWVVEMWIRELGPTWRGPAARSLLRASPRWRWRLRRGT